MNNLLKIILIFIFITNCSFNSNSKFWTKETNVKVVSKIEKSLFLKEKKKIKEFNSELKIKFQYIKKKNNKVNIDNNNGRANFIGNLKKISKYKFSKIKYFDQYQPEIIFEKDNLIFFNNKGSILKFDKNSKLIWKKNYYSKQEKKISPLLFFAKNKNTLIVADNISKYYAVNIETGDLLWTKYNNAPFISDIKIKDGKFFVIDSNNVLKSFSLKDGSLIWEYKSDSSVIKSIKKLSIVIVGNKIIFNNSVGDINTLNIDNGNLIWIATTADKNYSDTPFLLKLSDLVINRDALLFSNSNDKFYSININTGFINWTQKLNSEIRPIVVNGLIFTVTTEGYLFVIDSISGKLIRITDVFDKLKIKKRRTVKPVGFIIGINEIFLSTSNGKLLIIDFVTGKTKTTLNIDNSKISKPFVSNKNLYLIKDNSIIRLN